MTYASAKGIDGFSVSVEIPASAGEDWNDVLMRRWRTDELHESCR